MRGDSRYNSKRVRGDSKRNKQLKTTTNMKTENTERVQELIQELKQLKQDIYDYDYDRESLWNIENAITALENI